MSSSALETYSAPELKAAEFSKIRDFALQTFGLDLRQGKERLVSTRLGKHIKSGGFRSFDEYFKYVQTEKSGDALLLLIDSLTTNHTSFLRERAHFNFLTDTVYTELRDRKRFAVWSAASSTGEEPYSILFSLLDKTVPGKFADVSVTASDISTRVLAAAQRGSYTQERIAGIPPHWVGKYMRKIPGTPPSYEVLPEFRARVSFRRVNLVNALPPQRFSVIFCRNVMIYFNKATQADVVNRLAACLEPGGYLFVGHAESLTGVNHPLQYVRPAVYRSPR